MYYPRLRPYLLKIKFLENRTKETGRHPLWSGYNKKDEYRTSDQVKTSWKYGAVYKEFVEHYTPTTIVEFGTAFGVQVCIG